MTRQIVRVRGLIVAVLAVLLVVMLLEWWSPSWWRRISYPLDYEAQIKRSATRYKVDPYLVLAMIRIESSFDPEVRSSKGAVGLMQVLPSTARYVMRRRGRTGAVDLKRPAANIDIGTYYMRYLLDRYHDERYALAAYNGGEANMDRWLKGRESDPPAEVVKAVPFRETREFVGKVLRARQVYRTLYPDAFRE